MCSACSWATLSNSRSQSPGGTPLVYHIAKIEASKVILVGVGEHSRDPPKETAVGDLVDYYEKVDYVEDIVVRAVDFPCIEDDAGMVRSSLRVLSKCSCISHIGCISPKEA